MDKRIGILNEDGSVKTYPELSLAGQRYDRTQDRLGIGGNQFVYLDRFLSAQARDALLAELKPAAPAKDK